MPKFYGPSLNRRDATLYLLASGALLASPTLARAADLPVAPSVRLHYQVSLQARGFPLNGKGELVWQHDGQTYDARLTLTSLVGTRSQHSAGRLTPQGLAPERYVERARREETTLFERAAKRITFSGGQPPAPLAAGTQDRLSLQLQLGALLASDAALRRPGATIELPTATTHDAQVWHFKVEALEELQLPGGHQQAWRLQRLAREPADQQLELWFAPAQAYMPVRLRLTQPGGDWLEQQWSGTDRT